MLVQSRTIYNATLFNSLFFSFSIIFDVAWTTLFLIINHQRLSNELIAANTELMDLNKIKDRFFAIIAHDLKNPFSGIIGISNLLLENIRNTETNKVEELIRMIKNTAEQTYSLLSNLLSWAKTQIGAAVFNPGSYNLRDIIEDTIAQVKTTAESKRILIKNRADDAVVVFVDKDMIAAVIRNVLMNAVKFSFPDNEIIIGSREDEHTATLSVRDRGTGISKDDLSKLFKPGEKIVSKGTNNEEGSGIGLLLCKEYVEINAGRIWVESEPGKGSTVNVSLKKIHAREPQSTTSR
jgi:two-component system sensor histidine kinase/response regulator